MPKNTTTENTFDLLGKFQAGWYGEKKNCSLTTYDTELSRVLCHAHEGTVIVDGSECEYGEVCRLSISGPIRDVSLPPNSFRSLFGETQSAEGKLYSEFRSLDTVSLDLWLAEAKRIGARVGVFRNGQVVWEVQA
jgi:hypothetical protein